MLKARKLLKFSTILSFRVTCLFILISIIPASAQQHEGTSAPARRRIIFSVVQQPPEFSGGTEALYNYLAENLKYPEGVDKKLMKQTVFVNFIVSETGEIDSARVIKPVNDLVDAEVIRVIENMPAWIPGKQNGYAVAVRYNLPIHFPKR